MGRPKKVVNPRIIQPKPEPEVEIIDREEPEVPIVAESHRVVRQWTDYKYADELDQPPQETSEPARLGRPPGDPIAAIVQEMALNQFVWSLHVNRLPNYERDQSTHPKSRKFVGTLQVPDARYLEQQDYLEEIQLKFARPNISNYFYLCVRRDNKNHAYLPVVSVEPLPPQDVAKLAAENPTLAPTFHQNGYQQQPNSFADTIKQFKQLADLRDLFLPPELLKNLMPKTAAESGDLTTERALLHIVAQDGEVIDNFTNRLKGVLRRNDGGHDIGIMDLVDSAIKANLLPNMIKEAKSFLLELKGAVNPAAAATPSPQSQTAQATPPPGPGPVSTLTHEQQRLHFVLNEILQACAHHVEVDQFANWILENEASDRDIYHSGQVSCLSEYLDTFINGDPDQVLAWVSANVPNGGQITSLPHCRQWLISLQTELKNQTDEGPANLVPADRKSEKKP